MKIQRHKRNPFTQGLSRKSLPYEDRQPVRTMNHWREERKDDRDTLYRLEDMQDDET